ncbi:DUF1381 domain-containing protein [Staphylococcus xylosus]|uniref:DUF1381 domain-containing protein n=1 Tax=Staphylococcus xylosus TaxID=1288 RepID=UPI0030C46058
MQYLIKHTTHTTGETFTDVTKIRDNETYQVVEAESKEDALEISLLSSDKNKEGIRKLIKIQRMLG